MNGRVFSRKPKLVWFDDAVCSKKWSGRSKIFFICLSIGSLLRVFTFFQKWYVFRIFLKTRKLISSSSGDFIFLKHWFSAFNSLTELQKFSIYVWWQRFCFKEPQKGFNLGTNRWVDYLVKFSWKFSFATGIFIAPNRQSSLN